MWPWKRTEEDKVFYTFFKNVLGFRPRNRRVYDIAFTHRSQSENSALRGQRINNERLEYLGDAVLSAVVADYLYKRFPNAGEGFLTETRSKIVSRSSLGRLGMRIGLHELIHYDRRSQGVFKSLDGDAFEALMGAIYLEKGYKFTSRVIIERILTPYLDIEELSKTVVNYKGKIQTWAQKRHKQLQYEVINVSTVNHGARRQFEVCLKINGNVMATATDFTIKSAEQRAAEKACRSLKLIS